MNSTRMAMWLSALTFWRKNDRRPNIASDVAKLEKVPSLKMWDFVVNSILV